MLLRLTSIFCLLLLPAFGLPSDAFGQEEEEEEEAPQLPDIAPREIEIRGQLQIAFPSLERQPLQGFASPPTVPSVPENRRPYAEPYKQELEDLPESLPEMDPVTQSLETAQGNPARGFLETGMGRYFSRFAEGRLSVPLTSQETISLHGDYSGTEGFTPFESSSVQTPFDEGQARLSFESRRDVILFDANLYGSGKQYTLYGATPVSSASLQTAPDRDAYSVGTSLRLRTRGSVTSSLQATYDYTRYATQFVPPDQGPADSFTETRFGARGSLSFALGPLSPQLDADVTHSQFGGDVPGGSAFRLDAGGHLPILTADPFFLQAGVRALAYETPAAPQSASSPSAQATFVVPSLNAEWTPTTNATVFLRNTPTLRGGSLETLYAENPYAEHAPALRPTLETTNAEAGLTLSTGLVRITTSAEYRYAPSFEYFEPGGDARYMNGIFQPSYGSARILQGEGRIALQGGEDVQASVGVSLRDGTLTENDTAIPNFAPLTADAMVSLSFADNQALFQVNGRFESPRYATTAQTQRLDSYLAVDLEASYDVTSIVTLVGRAENLALQAPQKWSRYPQPPAMLSAGLQIRW